jgi:hypothetical protein
MPTPVESAHLCLKLFELRREPVLREARQWFLKEFNPQTPDELFTIVGGERNASFRMVLGYWEMAASFVTFEAIDAAIFRAANGEIIAVFAKLEPFLLALRERNKNPDVGHHLETVVRDMPGATERAVLLREGFRRLAETARAPK